MIDDMETSRRTWNAALKLAVMLSVLAACAAVTVSQLGDLPEMAIVLPVIVIGFTASWIQTGRIRRESERMMTVPLRSVSSANA